VLRLTGGPENKGTNQRDMISRERERDTFTHGATKAKIQWHVRVYPGRIPLHVFVPCPVGGISGNDPCNFISIPRHSDGLVISVF
jgi:hypothetical protein